MRAELEANVAEGVEHLDILHKLKDMGIDEAQGFIFAQPQDLEEILEANCFEYTIEDGTLNVTPIRASSVR